jgi:hypothetical protein
MFACILFYYFSFIGKIFAREIYLELLYNNE